MRRKGVGRKLMAAVTCAAMLMSSVPLHVQAEEIVSAEEVQGEEDSILLAEESLPELSAPQGDEVSYEESSLIESNASVQEDSFSAEDAAAYGSLFSDHTSDCYDRLAVSASVVRNAPGAALRFDDISVSVIERNVT